jgi:uncharacterized protein YuzE
MTTAPGDRVEQVTLHLTWDGEADAGYVAFTTIADGEAVSQRVVESPFPGAGDVVLDFNADGRVLGIEFVGGGTLPPGLDSPGG